VKQRGRREQSKQRADASLLSTDKQQQQQVVSTTKELATANISSLAMKKGQSIMFFIKQRLFISVPFFTDYRMPFDIGINVLLLVYLVSVR